MQLSQELRIVKRDPDFVNPFRQEAEVSMCQLSNNNIKTNYRTDASITPPSSKAPPPSFELISELAMHASVSPPQN